MEKFRIETNPERIEWLLSRLAEFTDTPGEGVTRLTFTDTYNRARDFLADQLAQIGMQPRISAHGNLRARLPSSSNQPAVLTGSHIDTVVNGGAYDGAVGVVAAIEAARVISEAKVELARPIEVIVFAEEEGTRFGSLLTGSKVAVGRFSLDELKGLRDAHGKSYVDCLEELGLDPGRIAEEVISPGEVKAMLELHIEQSVVLERARRPVGVVDRIVGSRQVLVRVEGVANHAGATPMTLRADALAGSAEMIAAVETVARRGAQPSGGLVATVGKIDVSPNAANVIPGRVDFTVDVRDVEAASMENALQEIVFEIEAISRRRGLGHQVVPLSASEPVVLSAEIAGLLESAAARLQVPTLRMASGAVHDAAVMAQVAAVGMIFVPSRGGRSHCPEEYTSIEDIKPGADLLLHALIDLATE